MSAERITQIQHELRACEEKMTTIGAAYRAANQRIQRAKEELRQARLDFKHVSREFNKQYIRTEKLRILQKNTPAMYKTETQHDREQREELMRTIFFDRRMGWTDTVMEDYAQWAEEHVAMLVGKSRYNKYEQFAEERKEVYSVSPRVVPFFVKTMTGELLSLEHDLNDFILVDAIRWKIVRAFPDLPRHRIALFRMLNEEDEKEHVSPYDLSRIQPEETIGMVIQDESVQITYTVYPPRFMNYFRIDTPLLRDASFRNIIVGVPSHRKWVEMNKKQYPTLKDVFATQDPMSLQKICDRFDAMYSYLE